MQFTHLVEDLESNLHKLDSVQLAAEVTVATTVALAVIEATVSSLWL